MLVSFIIPAYNVSSYVFDTLDSLFTNDDFSLYEVILVNDGSKDNLDSLIENSKYIQFPNFKYIKKENNGHGSCINVGLKISNGKYIKILDGDDWVEPSQLKPFLDFVSKQDNDIVIDSYNKFFMQSKTKEKFQLLNKDECAGNDFIQLLKKLNKNQFILMPQITIKRDLIKQLGIEIDERISYDDAEFNVLCVVASSTFSLCDFSIYVYRIGREGQSISKIISQKRILDKKTILSFIFNIINKESEQTKITYLSYYAAKAAVTTLETIIESDSSFFIKRRSINDFIRFVKKNNEQIYKKMFDKEIGGTITKRYKFSLGLYLLFR